MIEITTENWEREINSEKPIFICFLSNNMFCEEFLPILYELEEKYKDRMRFGIVDAKKNIELVIRNSIFVTPSFVIYYKGFVVYGMQGFREKRLIEEKISRVLYMIEKFGDKR